MRNKYSLLLVLISLLLNFNFVNAEMLVSDAGVKYDFEIVDYFNNQTLVQELISRPLRSHAVSLDVIDNKTWISVIIYLKNPSEIDNLISDFSEDELKNVINRQIPNKSSPEKIGAEITKEGFNKLLNDSRVEKIYYDHPVYLSNGGNPNKNIFIILLILGVFILFILIVYFIIRNITTNLKRRID